MFWLTSLVEGDEGLLYAQVVFCCVYIVPKQKRYEERQQQFCLIIGPIQASIFLY